MSYYLSTLMTRFINRLKSIPVVDHRTNGQANPFFAAIPVNVAPCPENNFGLGLFGKTDL